MNAPENEDIETKLAQLPRIVIDELTSNGRLPPPPVAIDMLSRIPAEQIPDIPVTDLRVLLSRPSVEDRAVYMRWYRRCKKYGIPTDADAPGSTVKSASRPVASPRYRFEPPPIAVKSSTEALRFARRALRNALSEVDEALSLLESSPHSDNE